MAIKVGDLVNRRIHFGMNGPDLPGMNGRVVYVHPEGRFYSVEFDFPGKWPWERWRFREAYIMKENEKTT